MLPTDKRYFEKLLAMPGIPCPELSGHFDIILDDGSNLGSVRFGGSVYDTSGGSSGSFSQQQYDGEAIPGWYDWVEPRGSDWNNARNKGILRCDGAGVWHWKEMVPPGREGTLTPQGG